MRLFTAVCCLVVLVTGAFQAQAQTPAPPAAKGPRRQLTALRLTKPVKLDGVLDEEAWKEAEVTSDFIQNRPNPGPHEKHPTEVRILYDDAALYIGAVMHDVAPDSILRELTGRDNFGNSDFFGIFLDTYHDNINGYGFFVTAAGVQMDSRYSPAGGEDFNWNAVWESRTTLRGTDWVAEMRIPYSAIRFSTAEKQVWGLQFMRQRKRENQAFFWSEVKPEVDGFVNQWGDLLGITGVKAPLRLSLTPYVSAYANHYPYKEQGQRNVSSSFNGGADIKYGINESFTLDATLVPDFGQTQSDNVVLNLSPFEVQFNENRQFFTEGTELFNKGNLFYSRRVGAQPLGFNDAGKSLRKRERLPDGTWRPGEELIRNPGETRLLNATKISGRTSKGLGIGVFNAISNDVFATARDSASGQERLIQTQPFSNYNIVVLDQSLKNNSYVSLINTNVTRAGRTYDANVTGGLFRFANKKNTYAVDGQVVYSRRRGNVFGSDTMEVNNKNGYKYLVGVGKIGGQFTWRLSQGIESDTYDPNDLGILFNNNSISQVAEFSYNKYKPFWKVNNFYSYLVVENEYLYKPTRFQKTGIYSGANTTFTKSFLTVGGNLNYSPKSDDYFEPRMNPIRGNYYVRVPGNLGLSGFVSSDYRKKLALDVSVSGRWFAADGDRTGRAGYGLNISPRYRVNNKLNFRYSFDWNQSLNQIGFAGGFVGANRDTTLLGRRQVNTVVNTVSGAYTFNNRMSFTIRTRHYSSNVQYRDFFRLLADGREVPQASGNRNTTFNAFNIDAVYSWWFAPGSQISVVWKNVGSTFLNAEQATPLYFENLNNTINTPHNNSVSIKVLYYLDYLDVRKWLGS
ncbi:carbohydrate binding family 9 domain-containing protein [Hymenobacter sp. BT175]|uniref:DUF5916 domain-containing protein n=1 Tax=Hymenobacter translucens TaxID=2886507 RepID=UPI001D0DF6C5|nr:DUF5916 domain-containing protein [Hymenobacter translucens]MCC2546959.1 carbohydrate binding family 9 domain-containing protein [Hymenobacter translucens]